MSETVTAFESGVQIPIGDLEQTFTYNATPSVTSISVVYRTFTYVQTFTYSGPNVINISQWVKQ